MEKKYNYVYLVVNKVNGKGYVGSHTSNEENDNYFGSGLYIKSAVKKYKRKNFIKIILQYYKNILEARKAEESYVVKFDTLHPNGYNISPTGGIGVAGCHSEDTIIRMKNSHSGKTQSQETKNKIANARMGISSGMLGKHQNKQSIEKRLKTMSKNKINKI